MEGCPVHPHGTSKAKGCTHVAVTSFSKLFQLDGVPLSEEEAAILGGPGGIMHDYDGMSADSEIPSGYIFFAQFVDHDITLDTTSGLRDAPRTQKQIAKLPSIRSASLDLDCVYGFGPEASPHIYDPERPGRIAENPLGYDLARSPGGTALIGDPRNDENIFVSQMQLLFHRFHNKLYNERVYQEHSNCEQVDCGQRKAAESFNRFEEAQKQTRYHYQWLVLFDFLKRLCDPKVYKFAAKKLLDGDADFPCFYKPLDCNGNEDLECGKLTMPVEFSVAAYRVGHTLVRSVYAVNDKQLDLQLFDERFSAVGFSTYPQDLVVDWRYLLPVDDCLRPRMTKAVDPLLADEIQNMPKRVVNSNNPSNRALAFRNLMRGNAMSLPSGQAVRMELIGKGYPIEAQLDLCLDQVPGWTKLDAIARKDGQGNPLPSLRETTPLFYYILRESELLHCGQRLGPVGSAILMEVFGGMLKYCKTSFLNEEKWNPDPCVSKERHPWWPEKYQEGFKRKTLISAEGYYPFELADVVRFVDEPKRDQSAT